MYFVNREKIEKTLHFIEELLKTFPTERELHTFNTYEKLALERVNYLLIESIIDVGNSMIDGFIMRDPGSYEDIIDILVDEKVMEESDGLSLKALILLRKPLVQAFIEIDHQPIWNQYRKSFASISGFPQQIRRYLVEELGPVSAFLPQE
ncbi:DUF86 domain-containing protein [Alkalihalobacillus pseudalcaliphilus]|uniref:DUF86 domain-containing protein n=1 Tax=Alkalihalobacillus pseudalcaliphilus TaxID=79884 RepID=UPI00064DEF86|nr:DUF86 domain-containing protein [Alkalihalobacillus pseudalcaliphilus]KMK77653.1 hypothetical protein AB990_04130 [Alkalihalobacillus pseudalcaliphilus]